ncbi:MAG: hypothetical protein WB443_07025, partial [Nitrososphaeraceae archaeon]
MTVNQPYDSFVDNVFSLIYKLCFRANHSAKVDAEAILQSKNVPIETIDEHITLNEELNKHGISTKDIGKFVNVIKNMEQEGYDTKKIVAKARNIKSLKDNEKHLKNNSEMLAKRVDKHRQILPLAEK